MTKLTLRVRAKDGRVVVIERECANPYGAWAMVAQRADELFGAMGWEVMREGWVVERTATDPVLVRVGNAANAVVESNILNRSYRTRAGW